MASLRKSTIDFWPNRVADVRSVSRLRVRMEMVNGLSTMTTRLVRYVACCAATAIELSDSSEIT